MKGTGTGLMIVIAAALLAQVAVGAPMMGPQPTVVQGGFQTPESVLYDPRGDAYLVSNINGNPTGTDGNGFISRVSPAGKILALKWIDGTKQGVTLNAPKGTAISGTTLYVADITAVRMFDRSTGRLKGSVDIPGSTFVNDLAEGSDGSIYVTDSGWKPDFSASGTDAVYRIDARGKVTQVAKGTDLGNPNGIAVAPGGRVLVTTGGPEGEVYELGMGGKKRTVATTPSGGLDGLQVLPGGGFLVSSWGGSAVYRVARDGMAKPVVENVKAPADIGYDGKRSRVLIPLFMDNKVVIQALK
ncbi:MAG: SMP-30/gluconolactonase/LRE family protein [bacterium]